jgi:amino acid transporter
MKAACCPRERGLSGGTLGFALSLAIGVASTAPAYSVATSLGVVAAVAQRQSPGVIWLAFVPMLCAAVCYDAFNRVIPDCGTTFTWVARSIGPKTGWLAGWASLVADFLVMASLGRIAGQYTLRLLGFDALAESTLWVTLTGVAWIATLTWICYVGIEISAKTQCLLLVLEIAILVLFAGAALEHVTSSPFPDSVVPRLSWLNPFELESGPLNAGVLVAVFIYWGWDTTLSLNEETKEPRQLPGYAGVLSIVLLLALYVLLAVSVQAVHGPEFLIVHKDDVLAALGSQVFPLKLDRLLDLAVLTSAAASAQTTILPATRLMLAMAAQRAAPSAFAKVSPRFKTPSVSTLWIGGLSCAWCVSLALVSEPQHVIDDAVTATGLAISFYLSITGLACVIYFRESLWTNPSAFIRVGLSPAVAFVWLGYIFVRSCIEQCEPKNAASGAWFGIGAPLAIGAASLVLGLLLMFAMWRADASFFRSARETAEPQTRS